MDYITKARKILETWDKETLIDDILTGINPQDLKEFVEANTE